MGKLEGIFAALVTPFNDRAEVNYEALEAHVDRLASKGMEGFYVCGSTAESFLLSHEERKRILESVVKANAHRATVIAHCGSIGTDLTIDLAKHAVATGVDAVSAVTPFYFNFKGPDIVKYYCDIADEAQAPVIVYNIPKMSGVTVTAEMMTEMRKNPRIVGLKFTSQDFFALERIKEADPSLIVYNGSDEMCICGLTVGADGAIGSTYNIMGKLFIQLRDAINNQDVKTAQELQHKANYVIKQLGSTGKFFASIKHIISLRGIEHGSCRRPFPLLTEEDKKLLVHVNDFLLEMGIDY